MPEGWSGWRPTADDGEKAAAQIADHVGRKYRLADDSQLVGVEGGPLEIDALGLTVPLEIAMKTAPQGGDIKFIEGNGLLYTLNGLGPKGAIRGGKPSTERALLLRREALELALYTFRYIEDVDLVVALLPAGDGRPGQDAGQEGAPPRRPPRRRSRRRRCSSAPATSSRSSRSRSARRSRRRPRARRRSRSPRRAASTR